MTYKAAFRQVMKDYETARDNADLLIEKRKTEVYQRVPEVADIDRALAKLGASLAKMALAGDRRSIKETTDEAQLLRDKRRLLLKNSVGEDYLTTVYRCMTCLDTGYLPVSPGYPAERCQCLKQRLIDAYYSLSNMKEVLEDENFDTYDLRLFDTNIVPNEGLSPHVNMQTIYRLATKFVADFDNEFNNLLLYGEPGLGKTFVCHCIAKDLLDAGRTVLYLTAPRLCRILEDFRFNRESIDQPDELLATIDEVDLLILDDLGAEISTIITSAALFDLINQRLLLRKHTVISTNLTPTALEAQYSERIVSRFFGNYQMIKFFGEDIRVKKKYGGLRMS
ncbi:MAG: ATP-binding protein [Firmicutes bacterium]|nr:ATP-binding protein [Bacillota bacterium]